MYLSSLRSGFFTFINFYALFLGPALGVMIADYWLVRKRDTDIPELYKRDESSKFWYWKGFSVAGVASLVVGALVSLPLMETARFVFLRETYSVIETLRALWTNEEFALAALIGAFSVATPILKAGLLTRLHLARPGEIPPRPLAFVNGLGKWSLTEVLVVAAIIVLWSSNGFAHAASLPGLWIFAGSAVLLMLAAGRITGDLARNDGAGEQA